MNAAPLIPWPRVAAFVRQHMHDVRNELNVLSLEAEVLQEALSPGGAEAEGVGRMRQQMHLLDKRLRSLCIYFHEPQPMPVSTAARTLLLMWQATHGDLPAPPQVQWVDELGPQRVLVDAEMMAAVFRELLSNAEAFSPGVPLTVTARAAEGQVILELREPKPDPLDTTAWGEPFVTTRHGGYGLGLWTARRAAEANGATLTQHCADGCLISQIALSVSGPLPPPP